MIALMVDINCDKLCRRQHSKEAIRHHRYESVSVYVKSLTAIVAMTALGLFV